MAVDPHSQLLETDDPKSFAKRLRWTGWFMIVIGVLALVAPFVAGYALQTLLAVLLVLGGVGQCLYAFQTRRGSFAAKIAAGILILAAGVLMLAFPDAGVVSIAIVLGVLFFIEGLAKVAYGLPLRGTRGSGWLLFSGALSILLALIIWIGLPGAAPWILGVLIGVGLVFNGLFMLALASQVD
jgi:uncharacterized membrane protein HdeD (DUF308 family)